MRFLNLKTTLIKLDKETIPLVHTHPKEISPINENIREITYPHMYMINNPSFERPMEWYETPPQYRF